MLEDDLVYILIYFVNVLMQIKKLMKLMELIIKVTEHKHSNLWLNCLFPPN